MVATGTVRGLYAITDTTRHRGDALIERVEAVLRGGAAVIQYRDKSADAPRRRHEAAGLLALCREHGALFVVNDDVELAARIGAPAVHLGRHDPAPEHARQRLGAGAIVGVSCYDSLERADRLAALGADYLAFGRVYPSSTKPDAVRVDRATLATAVGRYRQPVVAIGGIDAGNAAPLVALGLDAVAVIGGVFAAPDPGAEAARIAALFRAGPLAQPPGGQAQ